MQSNLIEKLINNAVSTGAKFCDIFFEDSITRKIILNDKKIDKIDIKILKGVGIRILVDNTIYYASTNDISDENLNKIIEQLKYNGNSKRILDEIKLNKKINKISTPIRANKLVDDQEKKDYLHKIDEIARNYDSRIAQVEACFYEYDQNINVGNTYGKYVETNRTLTRLIIKIIAKNELERAESTYSVGSSNGYEFLEKIDIEKEVKTLCDSAIKKLDAKKAPSGMMPVIVGNGFGVLIHEAVGHSLEATTVAKNISFLSNKIGQKVASEIVTVVDDGTISNSWGSILIDDEGNYSQKNICIENGILKQYLVDEINAIKMNCEVTGNGRRENYHYAPTSRMTNTNLCCGNNTFEEMVKSIKFGLYAKVMGGGSVDPVTGDFNFSVNEAYVIRDGQICEMVRGASLLGNTSDVMNNIEMISDDFDADTGVCGSVSGNVPVTCGQPTIKISSILVGGGSND